MELGSNFVGTGLKEYACHVTARWMMNYAASIGDPNPLYFDDERPGGIIAPPLFPVAVTWPAIEGIADNIESKNFPKEIIFTQVHYTEHLRCYRPVKPGDDLSIKGAIAAILPHKAGTYVVIQFVARDAAGKPVFTEHIGAMMRGVRCADSGKGSEHIPEVPQKPDNPIAIWESTAAIDPLASFIYDGCTNIHFPIHTSVKFARQVGLPGIIHQGTATLAVAVRDILSRESGGDSTRMESIYCRFTGMVLPGTDIKIQLAGKKPVPGGADLFFTVLNAEKKRVISDGWIRLKD